VDASPLNVRWRWLAINGMTEHVKHPRDDIFADWHLQRPTSVFDRHPTRQTLRGSQSNATHPTGIKLSHYFDGDLSVLSRAKQRVYRR